MHVSKLGAIIEYTLQSSYQSAAGRLQVNAAPDQQQQAQLIT